jgi:L-asparagine transporter-like permease
MNQTGPAAVLSYVAAGALIVLVMRMLGGIGDSFASIKVGEIIAFIAVAAGWLLGIGGGDSPGLSNLTAHDGFFPAGPVTVLSGVVIVIFAFVGAKILTTAAGDSEEPERAVARAVTRSSRASSSSTCCRCSSSSASCRGTTRSSATRRSSPRSGASGFRAPRTS